MLSIKLFNYNFFLNMKYEKATEIFNYYWVC